MNDYKMQTETPPPWDGQAYSVKRHGVTLTNCDSEPVQTPGCVQAHGAILVLRQSDLTILQASENTAELLGHAPGDLAGKAVAEALEMVDARREESRCDIVVPRPLPPALCDRVRVREVFVNLLSNSLKYTDKPRCRIEVGFINTDEVHSRPGIPDGVHGHTIYYVADNGIGIQAKHFGQVFKMFKRLHGRDEYGGGTGAGLTIVQKLVERHRGRVWVESTLGEGATFFFTLPCDGGHHVVPH